MSLKDDAKAAEASLRKVIKDVEQLGWLTVISKYNSELKSNLQLARTDVERLTNEAQSAKTRAASAEAKTEGLETTIDSLRQQLRGNESREVIRQQAAYRGVSDAIEACNMTSPRVEFREDFSAAEELTTKQLLGLSIWPGITGLGGHPRQVRDREWVNAVQRHVADFGVRNTFADLLVVLRQTRRFLIMPPQPDAVAQIPATALLPSDLPPPRAVVTPGDRTPSTSAEMLGLILNPIYAGTPPFPVILEESKWLRAVEKAVTEDGLEQVLVDMLSLLKQTYGEPGHPGQFTEVFAQLTNGLELAPDNKMLDAIIDSALDELAGEDDDEEDDYDDECE